MGKEVMNAFSLITSTKAYSRNCRKRRQEAMKVLVQHPRIDINLAPVISQEKPIHCAVWSRNPMFLKKLLTCKEIDVNAIFHGISALKFAVMGEYNLHVDLLLRNEKTVLEVEDGGVRMPVIFDMVEFGTPLIVEKGLAAGANPNSMGWSEMIKFDVSVFEWNVLFLSQAKLKEARVRMDIGKVLLNAGARGNISMQVWDELKKVNIKKRQKDFIDKLVQDGKNVPNLLSLARGAIHSQARRVTGHGDSSQVMKSLVDNEMLPIELKNELLFGRVIKY
jgi:hypothetical protein